MNQINTYEHPQLGMIRCWIEEEKVYFLASEMAKGLGYSSTAAMTRTLDDDEKGMQIVHTLGGNQQMLVISEAGFYHAAIKSRVEKAKEFRRWVTHEVLPQIRKTGGYIHTTPEMSNDEIMARGYLVAMATIEQKEKQLAEAQQTIEEQKPMVQFAEAITASQAAILIGDLAKLITQNGYKIGRTTLFKWLRDHGFLFKNETRPYQIWVEKGLFEISETLVQTHHGSKIKITTKVTPKGQRYFLDIFKKLV